LVARLLSPFLSLRRQIRERGLWVALGIALGHLGRRLRDRREILFFVNLPGYRAPLVAEPGQTCRPVTRLEALSPEDLEALREYAGRAYLAAARKRFERGWILYAARVDGALAGGGWILTARHQAKIVPLLDGDVSILDCFTLPAMRGRNVFPHLLATIATEFRDRGGLRAFCSATPWNAASIRALEKAGFARGIEYRARRLGRRELVTWLLDER
jgi:GNAT superfamily N-acetyltransferase